MTPTGEAEAAVVTGSVPFETPWLTEHNLAAALARQGPVVWLDPPRSPATLLRARRHRSGPRAPGPVDPPHRLHVRRPLVLPPVEGVRAGRWSRPALGLQLRAALRGLPDRRFALLARDPGVDLGRLGAGPTAYLVKDWNPGGAALLGRRSEAEIEAAMLGLCTRVDLVLAVTERLCRTLGERGVAARLLRHGFAAETADAYEAAERPIDLAELPRPLLGYVGRVDDRLDFEAIRAIADAHSEGTVVLIGPLSPRLSLESADALRSRANLRTLGPRPRASLPGYLMHLDACLLPYRPGPWGEHGSPLKLWEYLYAGAPIVGSGYEVLREYPDWVAYGAPEELAALVARALEGRSAGSVERRRAFALENTWDHRADELRAIVARHREDAPARRG